MYVVEITEDKMNNLMEHLTNAVDCLKEMKRSSSHEESHGNRNRRNKRDYDDYDDDYDDDYNKEERYNSRSERNRGSGGRYSRY